ncbi:MAG: TatD family hydrolase [Myxococcales bacterium]|nr:TatD family hydrolase [Myxococcales bacterium]
MIDTHCHLDVPRFDGDRDAVLARAWAAGVEALVVPAIGPERWEALLEWPAREARVQVGLGIHPQLLPDLPVADDDKHLARLDELLGRGGAIAVGECGLDGPSEAGAPIERQLAVLHAHVELARKHRLPLLLHCYRAHPHLQRYLKREGIPAAGLLLHSYSGSAELSPFYAQAGCHFSFAGPVSFTEARRPLEALRAVPEDRLMAETDAPDQAPHPHRGERSEPAYLPLIVEAMAAARGVSAQAMRALTGANARRFFGDRLVAPAASHRA